MALLLPTSLAQKTGAAQSPGSPSEAAPADPADALKNKRTVKGKSPQADARTIGEVIRHPFALEGLAAEAPEEGEARRAAEGGGNKTVDLPEAAPASASPSGQSPAAGLNNSWQEAAKAGEWSGPLADKPAKLKEVPQMVRNAKTAGAKFKSRELFQPAAKETVNDSRLGGVLRAAVILDLNAPAVDQVRGGDDKYLTLPLPDGKGGSVELELVKVDIFAPGFSVKTSSPTGEPLNEDFGVHYRGVVKGDDHSLAAISIFAGEVMGFYSTEADGNKVLGRFGGDNQTNTHVLYAEKDLQISSNFHCNTQDPEGTTLPAPASQEEPDEPTAACVRIYVEANFDLFQNRGTVTNTTNYVAGFFNQSAALFSNEGVSVSLSEVFVWTSPSPYTGTDSKQQLEKFQALRTSFNGNLAHLLTLQSSFGGIAYLPGLCNTNFSYAFSGVDPTFNNVPTFSWTVQVFTHETGHNLGSPHTQACFWNGNNTPIDGCVSPEGTCPRPGLPVGGGTIMSYCHLAGIGINFSFGFGPQPRNVIVNKFNSAPCVTDCGSTCSYALSASGESFGPTGGSGSFAVTSTSGCPWTAVSNVSWITTASSGSGNGNVSYAVASNAGAARTGTITVAGRTFTVTQSAAGGGGCQSTAISVGQTITGALATTDCIFTGTTRNVDVYTFNGTAGQRIAIGMTSLTFDTYLYLVNSGNQLLAEDDDGGDGTNSRIPFDSGFFTLPATGSYSIYATSFSSDGTTGSTGAYSLSLFGATTCTYVLNPTSQSFAASGGSGSFGVTTSPGCNWSAVSNASWLATGASGSGSGTVGYTVASNTGAARTGTITVAGQTFTVTQSAAGGGGCPPAPITPGQVINGTLTTSDCFFTGTTRYVDVYGFSGTAGQRVAVGMTSPTFDTYLYLLDSANQLIAQDDDGGGGTNSRIPLASGFFTLPATGNYTLYATSYSATGTTGSTGGYSISLLGVAGRTKTGVFRPSTGELFLKNSNSSGFADTHIVFGNPGDYPVAGDWNGDGIDTVGIYRNGVFFLRNTNSTGFADIAVPFGTFGDQPVVGDWNGDGVDTIGVYRNGTFLLRNSNTAGPPNLIFTLGNPGDVGIAGDWDGDGVTTAGVFRPSNGIVYLKNTNTTGFADLSLVYGNAGDRPVAGDWDGDGVGSVGILRGGLFFLRNSNTQGFADLVFALGNPGDMPIAGNWNGLP